MEITFELEDSDIVVDFIPDFDIAINCSDITKVQWTLQDGKNSHSVAEVFRQSQDPRLPTECIFPHM